MEPQQHTSTGKQEHLVRKVPLPPPTFFLTSLTLKKECVNMLSEAVFTWPCVHSDLA